jgi:hypothetical protein
MEVHAHSHLASGETHTARKKWTHYLWEFLMLFLAVFCGFLAENFREHQVEHQREIKYMESMLEDLASDTVMLQGTIQRATALKKIYDSLKNNLYDSHNIEKNILIIYRQNAMTASRLVLTSFSDQTATQLRNSGGMRLIRTIKIANAISKYWRGINGIEFTLDNFKKVSDERDNLGNSIFNYKYCERFSIDSLTLDNYFIMPGARLITNDENSLINYANRTGRLQEFIERFIMRQLTDQKFRAIDLIGLIKKEYKLK